MFEERVDVDGDLQSGHRIPRALTIPIDGYVYLPKTKGKAPRVGLTGGPRFAILGPDRGLGWSIGVDFVSRNLLWDGAMLVQEPDNLHITIGVEHIADVTFVALTVGVASRDRAGAPYR